MKVVKFGGSSLATAEQFRKVREIMQRSIEALDAMGSKQAGTMVPHLIRSVPTDMDRALFAYLEKRSRLG